MIKKFFLLFFLLLNYFIFSDEDLDRKLFLAVSRNDYYSAEQVIKEGANVNYSIQEGSILMLACSYSDLIIIKLLIENNANINETDYYGVTALMHVSFMGNFEIVELLLKNGADKSIKDNKNNTALDYAKQKNFRSIIRLLK